MQLRSPASARFVWLSWMLRSWGCAPNHCKHMRPETEQSQMRPLRHLRYVRSRNSMPLLFTRRVCAWQRTSGTGYRLAAAVLPYQRRSASARPSMSWSTRRSQCHRPGTWKASRQGIKPECSQQQPSAAQPVVSKRGLTCSPLRQLVLIVVNCCSFAHMFGGRLFMSCRP